MRTLILDMGGVIYSFSKDFDPVKHDENFIQGLNRIDKVFNGIADEYKNEGATKRVLGAEYYLIKNNILKIHPIKASVERLNTEFKSDNIVVVSTSLEVTSNVICQMVGLTNKPNKVFNASDFGSKKDVNTWKEIFETLDNIDIIVEDSEKNLIAADNAAKELGFTPKSVKSIMEI